MLVNPHLVVVKMPSQYSINKMKQVLQRQGQIEPLQVRLHGILFIPFDEDTWAPELVMAARQLRWENILVVVTDKYEP